MDRKLSNPIPSSLTIAQVSQPDKYCGVPPSTEPDAAASDIVRVIKEYLNETPYWNHHWEPLTVNQELEACIYDELAARNWGLCPQYLRATVHLMAAFTEFTYMGLTFPEKRIVTIFIWSLLYIDDVAPKNPAPCIDFQRRYVQGLPQLDPVLDTFAETFTSMYDIYDPLFANFIITSALEYTAVSCVETYIETFTPVHRPSRFPWFLRSRSGASISFAMMMFPKSGNHDFSACLRAMPDMDYSIGLTNDFFSFYKELLGNETETYVHHRAYHEEKTPFQTFSEIKREIILANENVLDILTRFGNEATAKAWKYWGYGYVLWHLEGDRYKLKDLNLVPK